MGNNMEEYSIAFNYVKGEESSQMNAVLKDRGVMVGRCSISNQEGVWTISAWYIDNPYQNKGLGRKLLFDTCEELAEKDRMPGEIQYNWNGTNNYVFDWLSENFSPLSMCPMSVLKYEDIYPADIPEGHLYKLVREQFIDYWKKYEEESKIKFICLGINEK